MNLSNLQQMDIGKIDFDVPIEVLQYIIILFFGFLFHQIHETWKIL
jgi:hypothetical protein